LESQANLALKPQAKCRFWAPQSLGKFKSLSQLPLVSLADIWKAGCLKADSQKTTQ